MKEDKREILTTQKIFADIKNRCWSEIKSMIGLKIFLSLDLLLITWLCSKILNKYSFSIYIYIFAAILPCILFSYQIYGLSKCLKEIHNGNYKIVTDKVVGKEENFPLLSLQEFSFYGKTNRPICINRRHFAFHFSSYDRYVFGKKQFLNLSDLLEGKKRYNSTHEGDEFYLAVVDDKWILSIYNTKYFRLSH